MRGRPTPTLTSGCFGWVLGARRAGDRDADDALARYFECWLLRLQGVYPATFRCRPARSPSSTRPGRSAG